MPKNNQIVRSSSLVPSYYVLKLLNNSFNHEFMSNPKCIRTIKSSIDKNILGYFC